MKNLRTLNWQLILVSCIAIFNVAFHLVFSNNMGYHRDELLYFSLGQHPAAGYETVPPLIGLSAWLIQILVGYSVYAVRLLPALFSGLMIFLVADMAKQMGASGYGSFMAAVGLTISIFFMRSFSLFQPVFLEITLWSVCIWLVIKFINTKKDNLLIFFGIAAGTALMNKYLAIVLFAGLIVIIPFTEYRVIFRRKSFYAGILAGLIVFIPNIVWQVSRGFPVFGHMSELYDKQLVHMDAPLFLTEQIMMPFAGSVFTVAGLLFLLFSKAGNKYRFLGFLSLFVIAVLMLLKGKGYYTLGVFPLLIAAGAVLYDKLIKNITVRLLVPLILVVITVPVVPNGIPVLNKEGMVAYFKKLEDKYGIDSGRRFEDGSIHSLPQDYADMLGWDELTAIAAGVYNGIEDKKACFIYCDNYGQAGAITIIGKKYCLPEAVSFHESFKYWFPEKFNPEITKLIYINSEEPGEDIYMVFKKVTKMGSIADEYAREFGTSVYLCEEPTGIFNSFWTKRTSEIVRR